MQDAPSDSAREAEQQLQQAMQYHQAGHLFEADRHYARVLALRPAHVQALRLRGILARTAGDIHQSVKLLSAAVEHAADSAQTRAELAMSLMVVGDLHSAEENLRAALRLAPNAIEILTNLAALLQHRGHIHEAIALYRQVLAQDASEFEVRCNLIKALADAGQFDVALQEADAAVAEADGLRGTLAAKGAVLVDARRYREAADVLTAAVARAPDDEMARINLALCQAELGERSAAIASLQSALEHNPHNARAAADLINCLSGAGEHAAALELSEQFLSVHAGERLIIGSYAQASLNAGQPARAQRLTDFDTLVQVVELDAPAPFANTAELNAELRQLLLEDPSLLDDPVGKATTGGAQTGELDLTSTPALRCFAEAVDQALRTVIDQYSARGLDTHPVMQVAAPHWQLRAWGTVLRSGGIQSPHMHPLGWLSAVYYVDLPDEMGAWTDTDGWLEFGAPPDRYVCTTQPPTRCYQPASGRLIVFPSWFWHRTLPFASAAPRISIAFDVMPSPAGISAA